MDNIYKACLFRTLLHYSCLNFLPLDSASTTFFSQCQFQKGFLSQYFILVTAFSLQSHCSSREMGGGERSISANTWAVQHRVHSDKQLKRDSVFKQDERQGPVPKVVLQPPYIFHDMHTHRSTPFTHHTQIENMIYLVWVWWHMPSIKALQRCRQEDH